MFDGEEVGVVYAALIAGRVGETDGVSLEMDKWKFAVLRDFQSTPLAKTGDTDREQMLVEYTLQASNEAASGGIFDLTTS